MLKLEAYLRDRYDVYAPVETTAVLTIRDTLQLQFGTMPRAFISIVHNPEDDRIVSGVNGIPPQREEQILEDIDKLVPEKSLEKLISKTVYEYNQQIRQDAERHVLPGDVRGYVQADDHCQFQTTKPVPDGIHPNYEGQEVELWQKPAAYVDCIDGSQGFLQLWLPTNEDATALISVTAGDYDRETVVEAVRSNIEAGQKTA